MKLPLDIGVLLLAFQFAVVFRDEINVFFLECAVVVVVCHAFSLEGIERLVKLPLDIGVVI